MKIITQTKRLYLREFSLEDAIHFYQMNLDDDVIKYTGDIAFKTEVEAQDFLSKYDQYDLHKMGRWAVCDKQTKEFLGWCGLKYHPKDDLVEVGYRFYKKHWNKGYATESAKASIKYGFETLKLKTIYAHAHIDNLASPDIEIRPIAGKDTIPVRHAVLRKGKPVEACSIPQDDLENTYHFGLFYKQKLVGVCTFVEDQSPYFNDSVQYRLRAMGVLEDFQGCRFGQHLLQHGVAFLKEKVSKLLEIFSTSQK